MDVTANHGKCARPSDGRWRLFEREVEEIVFLLKDYLQGKLVVMNTKKAGTKKKHSCNIYG